jgi:polysaccharide biosynthesis/export protein
MKSRSKLVVTFLAAMFLMTMVVGCGPAIVANLTPSAQLNEQARVTPAPEYLLQAGDDIEIQFVYNPELNQKLPVRPDGRISLPLVKELLVVGMSPRELSDLLTDKYRPELKKPEITVIVRTFTAQKIFIDGEVNRAGIQPIMGPLSVMQAISMAGGLKETARANEVLIIRQSPKGPFITTVVDVTRAIDGTDKSQDIALMAYDMVYVPKSPIANVDLWVDLYVRRLLPFSLPSPVPSPTYIK